MIVLNYNIFGGIFMEITREIAFKLWSDIYGNNLWAQDCFGTWMYRDDYGDYNKTRNNRPGGTGNAYHYGWDVDHIKPKKEFEDEKQATFFNNLEPLHRSNNLAKGDGMNFVINGINYQVVKCSICGHNQRRGYGIKNMKTGERVDWKYTKNLFYDTNN